MTRNARSNSYLPQARAIVADLFAPNPWIYWGDFLATAVLAYSCAIVFMYAPWTPGWMLAAKLGCYVVAGFALFRLALFMHELVHFKQGQMTALKVAWNLIAGVPMMVPSFLYESHMAHHNTHHYGTSNDGEYLPLGGGRLRHVLAFLGQILLLPVFVFTRFLIITPISFLHPRLRQFVLERMSSFVINFSYRREIPANAPRHWWAVMEWLVFARAAFVIVAIIALASGASWGVPWTRLLEIYALGVLGLGLNHLRTLAAHKYRSDGQRMTHAEQLEDSVNITGVPLLTELLFPLGLRYHGLHHAFPSLPYHNLGEAHRRLMAELPADSAYHDTVYPSFIAVIKDLIENSRAANANPPLPADQWYSRLDQTLRPTPTMIDFDDTPPASAERQPPRSTEVAGWGS